MMIGTSTIDFFINQGFHGFNTAMAIKNLAHRTN
jgi:hypothetical protein